MKVAFVTEVGSRFKVDLSNVNMRTEYAWQYALDAEHIPMNDYKKISGYDYIIIIWPKCTTFLNAVGSEIGDTKKNKTVMTDILQNHDIVGNLKERNKKVCYMQEGPSWFFNDYIVPDQFAYYNQIAQSDIIFCHNEHDTKWYKGLYPNSDVRIMPSLMTDELLEGIEWKPEEKVVIGGNFAKWYGGFQSFVIAQEFGVENWIPSMHNKRKFEDKIDNLKHLPYADWLPWMKLLSTFKYAIHLMPTIAAGTFSMNCAYFGIPCIGNEKVDTQKVCYPDLSVDVEDIEKARKLAIALRSDNDFYNHCSEQAKINYTKEFNIDKFRERVNLI